MEKPNFKQALNTIFQNLLKVLTPEVSLYLFSSKYRELFFTQSFLPSKPSIVKFFLNKYQEDFQSSYNNNMLIIGVKRFFFFYIFVKKFVVTYLHVLNN